jgi:hypothetical protein
MLERSLKMRKAILVFLVICIFSVGAYAQEENVLKSVYAGYLTCTTYDDSLNVDNATDWRVGGIIELPTKIGTIKAYSIFNNDLCFTGYSLKTGNWEFGKIARPITQHRPHPVSAASHFEPASIGAIPGNGLGVEYLTRPGNTNVRVAVHETKNADNQSIPEIGCSAQWRGIVRLSSYTNEDVIGFALSYDYKSLSTTIFANTDSTISNFINYYVTEKTAVFSDFVYNPLGVEKYELGMTVDASGMIESVPLNILLGSGIVYRDPDVDPAFPELSFNLYIFITKMYDRK